MAASVSYRINGKYDGKAVNSAMTDITKLGKSAVKSALSFAGITASFATFVSSIKASTADFKGNNTAQTRMFKSLSNNVKTATTDIRKLVKEFDGMSGYFEGSEIVKAGGILGSLGLTENQMNKTIQVARDMAASGIMPLDQAAKALGITLKGNAGALKKMYPELANLSKEELKNGEAVEILGKKYAGMEEAMSKTFDGMDRKYSNALGGLKDSVGAIVSALQFEGKASLIDSLNSITDWFNKNRDPIINFFLNLPEIGKIAFSSILEDVKKLFSLEGLQSIYNAIVDSVLNVSSATLEIFSTLIKGIIDMIKAFCDNLETGDVGKLLLNAWYKICNQLNEMFFKVFDVAYELISGGGIKDALAVAMGTKQGQIAGKLHYDYDKVDLSKSIKAVTDVAKNMGVTMKNTVTDFAENQKTVALDFLDNFEGLGEQTFEDIKAILGKDLPEELLAAFSYGGVAGGNGTETGGGGDSGESWKSLWGSFGDIGDIITSALDKSPIGLVIKMIGSAISVINEKTTVLADIMNIFHTLFTSLFTPEFINMLNSFFGPVNSAIHSIFDGLGYLISIVSEIFTPIMKIIGKAVEIVSKVIQSVLTVCYNIYVACWNFFHTKKNEKEYKSISDIWSNVSQTDYSSYSAGMYSGSTSSVGSSTSGTAASYNAARDVIVNISFNNSYVNGDARQIAVSLYNEFKSAERMGYIS